jgi:N-acetylmuramic acid 6-phosphate etherase
MHENADRQAEEFLKIAHQFHLGVLPTESRHPETMQLSQWANQDLPRAIGALKSIDLTILEKLYRKSEEILALSNDMSNVLKNGNRVYFCGCGATGRLSLSIETLWLQARIPAQYRTSVVSFMAGGDVAIIKSIENFEDRPDFGARQLENLGFKDGDMLVASTEGGETPFVIGAVERAAEISQNPSYFLYCNPDDVLNRHVERSRRVIENPRIRKINLTVGPMALSGSTRMQASTILMMGAGMALFEAVETPSLKRISERIATLREFYGAVDISFLQKFVEQEAATYRSGDYVLYSTNDYGITVLTDTTERSPTFSLAPFENQQDAQKNPSLCYLYYPEISAPEAAWHKLLERAPRPLDWEGIEGLAGGKRLLGFDISANAASNRRRDTGKGEHKPFTITRERDSMHLRFDGLSHSVPVGNLPLLEEHVVLKMMLNTHSTLIMGRLGRYEGNIMTWVRPSNFKLIDRSVRYVTHLLKEQGIHQFTYADITRQTLREFEQLGPNEPVVLKVVEALKKKL